MNNSILKNILVIVAVLIFGSFDVNATDLVFDTAILRGLDKVTGRVVTIKAPIETQINFGTLGIVAHACHKRSSEEQSETAAFLDIWEARDGQTVINLFKSWMFVSSPSLSALEHPVYDIWVLDCKNSHSKNIN
ncbi:MAG: DUF2155 domain-containing protein [Rhodospirillaceae bacterium]|nr:DUF2155 domain-containing protein [Rhodospirillaceae bacterium]